MNIEIHKSTIEDFSALQELFLKMFELFPEDQDILYPSTEHGIQYIHDKINNGIAFSAKINNELVGFIFGSIQDSIAFKTYKHFGFIENLMVKENHQDQLIGSQLIAMFKAECKKRNINIIQTDSDFAQKLLNFYTKNDFKVNGLLYICKI